MTHYWGFFNILNFYTSRQAWGLTDFCNFSNPSQKNSIFPVSRGWGLESILCLGFIGAAIAVALIEPKISTPPSISTISSIWSKYSTITKSNPPLSSMAAASKWRTKPMSGGKNRRRSIRRKGWSSSKTVISKKLGNISRVVSFWMRRSSQPPWICCWQKIWIFWWHLMRRTAKSQNWKSKG